MRYITANKLADGMKLGSYLYDSRLSVMLGPGTILTDSIIQRINEAGYAGVYVDDDFTRDIVVEDVISQSLRLETIRSARDLLTDVERGGYERRGLNVSKVRQERIIMPVLEALIEAPRKLIDVVDIKPFDQYEYYHTANCIILSMLLGLEVGLSGTRLYELGLAALLRDVGNIFTPKEILTKPGALTAEEYEVVKQHTQRGFDYMRRHFDISIDACLGALHHHEHYDGSGYPHGLKKDKISIYGRIIAITDVFDALISRRPFRDSLYYSKAFDYLQENAGKIFDPDLVAAFRRIVAPYPAGLTVELNTGARCVVVENNPAHTDRPKLRLEQCGSSFPLTIDLHQDQHYRKISISRTVDA